MRVLPPQIRASKSEGSGGVVVKGENGENGHLFWGCLIAITTAVASAETTAEATSIATAKSSVTTAETSAKTTSIAAIAATDDSDDLAAAVAAAEASAITTALNEDGRRLLKNWGSLLLLADVAGHHRLDLLTDLG